MLQDVCVLKCKGSTRTKCSRQGVGSIANEDNTAIGGDRPQKTWAAKNGKLEPLVRRVDNGSDRVTVSLVISFVTVADGLTS